MLYTLRFFLSSKCSLFHNANLFGSCIIHILYTECAEIKKKNNSYTKGLMAPEALAPRVRWLGRKADHWSPPARRKSLLKRFMANDKLLLVPPANSTPLVNPKHRLSSAQCTGGTTLNKCGTVGTVTSVLHTPSSQIQGIHFPLLSFHTTVGSNAF